jgi:phosphopantetheinyl transferase
MSRASMTVAWAIAVKTDAPQDELLVRWLLHPEAAGLVDGPGHGEIACWLAAVSRTQDGSVTGSEALDLEHAAAVLDAQESNRLLRFLHHEDRRSYLAAHAGARLILGRIVNQPPESLRFRSSINGKPMLVAGAREIDFSLSHARGTVAVAAAQAPVGVDVEPLREIAHLASMSELVLAAEEQAVLRNAPEAFRSRLFLRYWTLKEALLKAAGLGFTIPANTVVVDAGPAPTVLSVPPALGPVTQWRLIAPATEYH